MAESIYNVIQLLQLVTLCCDGKSDFAEEKCKELILNFKIASRMIVAAKELWPLKISIFDYIINAYMDSNDPKFLSKPDPAEAKEEEDEEGGNNDDTVVGILLVLIEVLISDFDMFLADLIPNTKIKMPNGKKISMIELNAQYIFKTCLDFIRATLKKKNYDAGSVELKFFVLGARVAALFYHTTEIKYQYMTLQLLEYMYESDQHNKYLDNVKHPAKNNRTNTEVKAKIHAYMAS